MRREDACYFKTLLICGFSDGYDAWLDRLLEEEDPLSDIVLQLSLCASDINKTIHYLHNYCAEQPFDEREVCDNLRLFLKEAYHAARLSKEETVSCMHRFASTVGDPGAFEDAVWGDMFYMELLYGFAKDKSISWKKFDTAFHAYLDSGIPYQLK